MKNITPHNSKKIDGFDSITVEVNVPYGWEPVAYRVPKKGDHYLGYSMVRRMRHKSDPNLSPAIILKRKIQWRPISIEDIIEVLKGKVIYARFRETLAGEWQRYKLTGYDTYTKQAMGNGMRFRYCEIKVMEFDDDDSEDDDELVENDPNEI